MRTKDVEDLFGIGRETLRFYISEGLIDPARTPKNYRDYDEEDIQQIKRILLLRQLGVSIIDIRRYFNKELDLQSLIAVCEKDLKKRMIILEDAIRICERFKNEDLDISFDPDPYFKNYHKLFAEE